MRKILVLALLLSLVGLAGGLVYVAKAAEDTTSLSETLSGGTLSIVAPPSATFGGLTVSTIDQEGTAVIGDATHTNTVGVEVKDERGSGAGWSNTMTVTNLTVRKGAVTLAGTNSTVTASGTYDGVLGIQTNYLTFRVEITTGGAVGTAEYEWSKPGNDGTTPDGTAVVTSGTATELSNGVKVAFATATYVVGDQWSVLVDVFPYYVGASVGLEITPSAIHNESGSLTGVTEGSANQFFTGAGITSGALTVATANKDSGMGDYFIDIDLVQDVHKNSLVGEYTSTATLTVE